LLLWLVPPAVLAGGGLALWIYARRRSRVADAVMALTPDEEARLTKLLGDLPE
jgi:cytochrome c-type biogenesis protein CcmH